MPLIVPTLIQGLIFCLLALSVAITWRLYGFPDLTVDGSVTTGAAVAMVCIIAGMHPVAATLCGALAGAAAGALTGVLHAVFGVNRLLAGILVMSALYSVNLHVMSGSGLAVQDERTLVSIADAYGAMLLDCDTMFVIAGQDVPPGMLVFFGFVLVIAAVVVGALHLFLRSDAGLALRASGGNERMMRAQGVHTGVMFVLAVATSNALAAGAGAIFAQYVYSVDIALGIGMIIRGLAYVIIGQALLRSESAASLLLSAVLGALVYEILLAVILQLGDFHNDLRLITALFVLFALGLQHLLRRSRGRAGDVARAMRSLRGGAAAAPGAAASGAGASGEEGTA
jgi:putative ABC transport system permease protein